VKRLLIDVNSVVPYYATGTSNGIGRTTRELVQSLSNLEGLPFEIHLYSQNMKGIGARNLNSKFKNHHLYLPNRKIVNQFLAKTPLLELLTDYDLYHYPSNYHYFHKPEKTIVTLHDALFMHMAEKEFNHEEMRRTVPGILRQCQGIITCSESSKRDIVEYMHIDPEKINVIYWGVDHSVFKPYEDISVVKMQLESLFGFREDYYLSVSCNMGRKNTDKLIEAYTRLVHNKTDKKLILVWSNPPDAIKERIQTSNLEDRILFLSNITDQQLAMLYNGATAMIFPSSYEGFGLPLVEAMASSCPVVTCNNSSLHEVGGDAPIYIIEPSVDLIYEALCMYEDGIVDIPKQIDQGHKRAQMFNWAETAKKYVHVYSNYLGY
jgi:glycosyltransferase involved in cell wall biosynthesis